MKEKISAAQYTIGAWIGCFGAIALFLCVDYKLRLAHGNIHNDGIPQSFGNAILGLIVIIFFGLIIRGSFAFQKIWIRALIVLLQLAIAYVLLGFIFYLYTVGNGIDTL